jgi:hypothetical protein
MKQNSGIYPSRRKFIAGASAAVVGTIAGCTTAAELGIGSNDVFESVGVDEYELVVELTDESDLSDLSVIRDGELWQESSISAGETKVTFPLLEMGNRDVRWMYHPGEYTVVARGGEDDYEYDLTLEPDSQITDLEAYFDTEGRLAISVENTGPAPALIGDVEVTVPSGDLHETLEFGGGEDGNSLIAYHNDVGGDTDYYEHFPIASDTSVTFRPHDSLFGFSVGSGWNSPDHAFDSTDELEAEWKGEIAEVEIAIDGWELLEATAEILFEGTAVPPSVAGLTYFDNMQVVDFETH